MHRTPHPARVALAVLALVVQVGAGAASACASTQCSMPAPPVDTIVAACCCDGTCDILVAAETVIMPSEVSVSTPGITAQMSLHALPAASAPMAVALPYKATSSRLHLFQLHQSYRL